MRRWLLPIALLLIVTLSVVSVVVVRHRWAKRAQEAREASYQSAQRAYSEVFKPGMSRKQVEDYLRSRNVAFHQMCCSDDKEFPKGAYDDYVKIGQEEAPWFCSESNVYIDFHFIHPQPNPVRFDAEDSDTLKTISIFPWLMGCL